MQEGIDSEDVENGAQIEPEEVLDELSRALGISSSSEESSSSESESEDNNEISLDKNVKSKGEVAENCILRTENEINGPLVLKIPSDFEITDNTAIEPCGHIKTVGDKYVLVESNISAVYRVLDEGSIFCLQDKTIIGVLCETFGKVERPLYVVRFETAPEAQTFDGHKGEEVFYVVPTSHYIETDSLRIKGSDASNIHDEEIPLEQQEFSDDEQEQQAKSNKKRRKQVVAKYEPLPQTTYGHEITAAGAFRVTPQNQLDALKAKIRRNQEQLELQKSGKKDLQDPPY